MEAARSSWAASFYRRGEFTDALDSMNKKIQTFLSEQNCSPDIGEALHKIRELVLDYTEPQKGDPESKPWYELRRDRINPIIAAAEEARPLLARRLEGNGELAQLNALRLEVDGFTGAAKQFVEKLNQIGQGAARG